eukprot:TRINITY_DN78751_c0_g1_i1.p1 TRINITY_DN78751_c0_g1~~TRINITY_DN78751_c0_g1_i1.p1  ORF type:complete len:233 (-),score=10.58 TRINITY_DN78751_c0_g1_i1:340-1038(-)
MTLLRFVILLALVAFCSGAPTERTFSKKKLFLKKKAFIPFKKAFIFKFNSCFRGGCPGNTVCAGRSWWKKCVVPMPLGKRCGVDPYWVCERGLVCQNFVCRLPLIPVGGDCSRRGSVCVPGSVCVGDAQVERCVKPRGPGMKCGSDPFTACVSGLECIEGMCMVPKIDLGGDCKPEGSVCKDGLFCLGDNGLKKCVKGMTEGQKCGLDPFWSCQPGLSCIGRICTKNVVKKD